MEDPDDVANAILRALRQTEEGRACLLEFITSAETAFSHRQGAARWDCQGGTKNGSGW
ncbi:MAG: hypothetical protein ACREDI_02870 [Roseiarcus sp.]